MIRPKYPMFHLPARNFLGTALLQSFYYAKGQTLAQLIRHFSESQWLSNTELNRMQRRQLRSVLVYAYRHIPFYRRKFDSVSFRPEHFSDFAELKKIPFTTKDELRQYFGSRSCSFWEKVWSSSLRATSGSSGEPLALIKGFKSLSIMDAVMFRNYSWYSICPGDRQIRFWGSHFGGKRWGPLLKDLLLNRKRLSAFNISKETASKLLREIERCHSWYLYGYAQAIYQVARLLADSGWRNGVNNSKGIILTGEMISQSQRDFIEEVFKSRTINEYGCTEAGVIAMECPQGRMHLMENLWIEIARSEGMPFGEVIVTELSTDYFPLIRYQVGDSASIDQESCSCGRGLSVLSGLQGRSDDLIECPDGRIVDPYFFEYLISELPSRYGSVHQFKIIQLKEHEFLFLLVVSDGFKDGSIKIISERVQSVLGAAAKVSFNIVSNIRKDPSGKLRCFSKMRQG